MSSERNHYSALLSMALALGMLSATARAAQEAADEPEYWLDRMVTAAHEVKYEGTFVYVHNDSIQTMRIIDDGERERMMSLSGLPREVVRDGEKVTCILPDDRSVMLGKAGAGRPLDLNRPVDLAKLSRYYTIRMDETERVAGRSARKLSILPRDRYRYGRSLWLDEDTGLLVGTKLIDKSGRVLEQLMFTSLSLKDEIPEEMLKPETAGTGYVWDQDMEHSGKDGADWEVTEAPPGFEKGVQRRHLMPTSESPVEHLVYSDGLSSVSVFIERRDNAKKGFVGSTRLGAVNAYAKELDGHRVTVVGEVPEATVRMIGENVVQRTGEQE